MSTPAQQGIGSDEIAFALAPTGLTASVDVDSDGVWSIALKLQIDNDRRPTRDAWLAIEFVTWFARDVARSRRLDGEPVLESWTTAAPPYLNRPGHMLTFGFEADGKKYALTDFITSLIDTWNEHMQSPKLSQPCQGAVAPAPTTEQRVLRLLDSLEIVDADPHLVAHLVRLGEAQGDSPEFDSTLMMRAMSLYEAGLLKPADR